MLAFAAPIVLLSLRGVSVDNRREVEHFAGRLDVLPYDAVAAAHSAEIRATLERRGEAIRAYDLLIAGHARSRGLVVVTGNLDEFTQVDGLPSEDWLGEPKSR